MRDITARIEHRTHELLRMSMPLCASYRVSPPDPVIRFDLRGQVAGQMYWRSGSRPQLRFNLDLASRHERDFLKNTVTHEVAHLITAACHGRTRPHGAEWSAIMKFLGVTNPKRCHDYPVDETKVRRQRRWTYRCDCAIHEISTTRHKRLQSGQTLYHCRNCGTPLTPDVRLGN